jgi:hypothetical protein
LKVTDEQAPLPVRRLIAGILSAQFILVAALAVYLALDPPPGKMGGLSIDLISRLLAPIFLGALVITVPLMLLAARTLRDRWLGLGDWAGTGTYAGFIGGAGAGIVIVASSLYTGFAPEVLLLAGLLLIAAMIVGTAIALLARPISLYFADRWL